MKKKLLLATPIYHPDIGGPATYVKELVEKLGDIYDISILTFGDQLSPIFPNSKLFYVNKNLFLPIRLTIYFLKSLRHVYTNDLVYVQNAVAAGLPIALTCKILNRKFLLKFVGDEAWERSAQNGDTEKKLEDFYLNPDKNLRTKIFLQIQKFVLQQATIVTTPSKYLRESIMNFYQLNPDKTLTNYNASNFEVLDHRELQKNNHQIITTARLTKFKGVDGIIHAVKILKEKYSDINFVICGEGPELENLTNLTKALDLESNVKFLGKVSRDETYRHRKESVVYVLNSIYEGLPHTALSTFQAEIPIIATNIAGTKEAVYDNVSGLLVEPNNPQMLAEKIKIIFEDFNADRKLCNKLVAGGTKILHEKFSWEKHIDNLKNFFLKIS